MPLPPSVRSSRASHVRAGETTHVLGADLFGRRRHVRRVEQQHVHLALPRTASTPVSLLSSSASLAVENSSTHAYPRLEAMQQVGARDVERLHAVDARRVGRHGRGQRVHVGREEQRGVAQALQLGRQVRGHGAAAAPACNDR
jgi:hypothetical protein